MTGVAKLAGEIWNGPFMFYLILTVQAQARLLPLLKRNLPLWSGGAGSRAEGK
jgi:hypothetical protein